MNDLERSIELAHAGRLAEAVEETRNQISRYPDRPYLNFWLGILLYDMGEYERACEAFRRELEITPRFRDAAWELGSSCSKLGRPEEAIKAYHSALDIDPCCIQSLFGLGNVYRRIGNYPEAIEYYKDVLFLEPDLDQSDPRASEKYTKSFMVYVHYNLGITWMMTKKLDNAKESFETVQKIGPGGRLAELSSQYLQLLSDPNGKLDLTQWNLIELLPEDL